MTRHGYTTQNWDSIPDVEETVPTIQVGDLVTPRIHMLSQKWASDPKGSIYICYENLRPESDVLTVCGYTQGTYMGPRRVTIATKAKSGSHWSSEKKIEKMSVLHHMFLFGSMQYSISLEDVVPVLDIYDDESDADLC